MSNKGPSRASLAGKVQRADAAWAEYDKTHHESFVTNNLCKFNLIDGSGKVIDTVMSKDVAKQSDFYANATSIRHEDAQTIQEMIVQLTEYQLNGISDLIAAGLTVPAMITDQLVGYESIDKHNPAIQEMNPNGSDNNALEYQLRYVPLPITHQGYDVFWRQQGFQYKSSAGLSSSVRTISERLEESLFNGNTDVTVDLDGNSYELKGYTNHPNRIQATTSDWSVPANKDKIKSEMLALVGKFFTEAKIKEPNSLQVYIPGNYVEVMDDDYSTVKGDATVRERLQKIPEIREIKFSDRLADGEISMVYMNPETVQLAIASNIVSIPHTKTEPMENQAFTTYAAMVHMLKTNSDGIIGVLHATAA